LHNFQSKCSIKIETNSSGHNTTAHAYEGVTFQQLDDAVEKAVYADYTIQHKIENKDESHCQKCGEWLEDNSVCSECGGMCK
jgi:CRISPR/Cas system CMR-associated protein Cmr1 (group 7 of RAMP superfamily)